MLVKPRHYALMFGLLLAVVAGCDKDAAECTEGVCAGDPCSEQGLADDCSEGQGTRYCVAEDSELMWGRCIAEPECEVGDANPCFPGAPEDDPFAGLEEVCELVDGEPQWNADNCNTPLVLAFENQPIEYVASTANFDIAGNGCVTTDWPTAQTPWLAFDRDRNGSIDGGHELFGNGTVMASGRKAEHGFAALRELDSNGDGRIDGSDRHWGELVLWSDHDADKQSSMWELTPVREHGVTAIELDYWRNPLCDARQNCEVERASFTYATRTGREQVGSVVDIYLACQ